MRSIKQGANGPNTAPQDPVEWVTGTLNGNKAHFMEGMSVPYQFEAVNLSAGETYCVTIGWNTKSGGKHTIDFLTSYDRLLPHDLYGHAKETVDPLLGTSLEGRNIRPQLVPIPVPKSSGSPVAGQPAASFQALPEEERLLAIFNGQIVNYGYVSETSLMETNASASMEICFRVNEGEESVVIAWGGHLAAPLTWGKENTASGAMGTPYVVQIEGCAGIGGCGAKNLALQSSIVGVGTACGISGPSVLCAGELVSFSSMAPGLEAESLRWTLTNEEANAAITGPAEGAEIEIAAGAQAGYFELSLQIGAEESCTRRIYVYQPEDVRLEPAEVALCEGAETIPLEWINLPDGESFVKELTLRSENGELIGTGATPEELFALLPAEGTVFYVFGTAYPADRPDCPVVETERVTVRRQAAGPAADFQVGNAPFCSGMAFSLEGIAPTDAGSDLSWLWDFGDGQTSDQQNPEHIYEEAGTYDITLTIFNEFGCPGASVSRQVTVLEGPQAAFSGDPAICEDQTVLFENNSVSGAAALAEFEWKVEGIPAGEELDFSFPFEEAGVYAISLTATDENGCADTSVEEIEVFQRPAAAFTAEDVCLADPVAFQQLSAAGDAPLAGYRWTFGDGATSEAAAPVHTYEQASNYIVQLTVTDENECSSEARERVTVHPPVEISAGPDLEFCEGETIQLEGAVSGGATTGTWSDRELGGTFTPVSDGNPLIVTYQPPAGLTGSVELDLISQDPEGPCPSKQATMTLTILEGVTVTAGDDQETCAGESIQLQGRIEGPVAAGRWSDGGLGGVFSPDPFTLTAAYTPPAAYEGTITLTLTSDEPEGRCGAESDELQLLVHPLPTPAFGAAAVCEGDLTVFRNFLDGKVGDDYSWNWDFGDGGRSEEINPEHRYDAPGDYTVTLEMTDGNGCRGTAQQIVTVYRAPVVAFTADPLCEDSEVLFTNATTPGDGAITSYDWQFGDATGSIASDPTHTFSAAGTYEVSLTVADANGCVQTVVQPLEIDPSPVADFEVLNSCQGLTVEFASTAVANGADITTYSWRFGDGSISDQADPVKTYEEEGNYRVGLEVTDANGCSDLIWKIVPVAFPPGEVEAGADITACEGTAVELNGVVTGTLSSGEWSDGGAGGTFTTDPNRSPLYAVYQPPAGVTGAITLTLTSNDPEGSCPGLTDELILTLLPAIEVDAGPDQTVCSSAPIQLNGSIQGDAGSWLWSDGDVGGTFEPDAQTLDASYIPPAGYASPIVLRLTGEPAAEACEPEADELVLTFHSPPKPDFEASNACEGDATFFSNLSEVDSGEPVSWLWNFGDGTTSTSANPGHLYSGAGTYTVSLQMTDGNGCSSTVEKEVNVFKVPAPSFAAENRCETERVQFINTTDAGADALYEWQFGDGFGSLTPDPTHRYAEPGVYSVSLTVTDGSGCSATIIQPVEILAAPEALFSVEEGCEGAPLIFTAEVTPGDGAPTDYEWRFGDGTTATGPEAAHTYALPGNFLVRLEVTDANGCGDVYRAPVDILPGVVVDAGSDQQVCEDGLIDLFGSVSGPVTTGDWSDGGIGGEFLGVDGILGARARYRPPAGWTDPITLTLTSDDPEGPCPAVSDELVLTIFPKTTVDAGADRVSCPGNAIQLDGFVDGGASAGTWSDGRAGGTFEPDANTLNARYLPPAGRTSPITLRLTAEAGQEGCEAVADALLLTFEAPPEADFMAEASCVGDGTVFENLSTTEDEATTSWLWSFGDGTTSGAKNPTHTYAAAGDYAVTLTVTNGAGCESSLRRTVRVHRLPEPDFRVEQPCEGQAVQFINESGEGDAPIQRFEWRFGEGAASEEVSPAHTYRNAGSFLVQLSASDQNGCSNRIERTVDIRKRPTALFETTPVCLGQTTVFDQQSLPGEEPLRSFDWDFGDGSTSDLAAPTHRYSEAGTYTVRLQVQDEFGCSDTYEASVTVSEPVQVDAGPDKGYCENGAVQLNGLISGSVNGGTWSDGGIGGRFVPNPQSLNALYVLPEGYQETVVLTLTSEDPEGSCPPAADNLMLFFQAAPQVAFQADAVCDRLPVAFENNSTAGSGVIIDVLWDFGDGQVSNEAAPSHVYEEAGTYEVTLTITNSNGCVESLTQPVTVYPRPIPNFVVDGTCPGQPMTFTNLSEVGDGLAAEYFWDFGDGSTSTAQDPVHTYGGGESYRVLLRVTDENGCSTALTKEVTLGRGPLASFTAEAVCLDEPMTFINTSEADAAALTKYYWDFGDGTSSEAANPQHSYGTPGTYTVQLTVEDNEGCQGTATRTVQVYAPPEPDFEVAAGCEQQQTRFTDLSVKGDGALTSFFWEFGNEASSSNQNPAYTYPEAGTYNIRLTVEDEYGCAAVIDRELVVDTPPKAAFDVSEQCVGTALPFSNNSIAGSNPILRYEWQFGDETTSSEESPVHTYAEPGTYNVVLTVFDEAGCSDSQIGEVTVFEAPALDFFTEVFCESVAVQFTAEAAVATGSIVSYAWDFGDGESSREQNPMHTYSRAGSFSATLEVTTDRGCSRSLTKEVFIPESPTAAFTVTEGCEALGSDLFIVNESAPAPGSTADLSYLWIVLDEREREVARSREEAPDFNLPPGRYTLELTASGGPECSGYASQEVRIYPDPSIAIEAAALRVCNGEGTTLTAAVEGGMDCRPVQWQWASSPTGPWNIIAGADGLSYDTRLDLATGTYYYRARYRCDGRDCGTATSNVVAIEVGQGEAALACLGQLNVTLDASCTKRITPAMVGQGTFGYCFPYRVEDFEVIVYDGVYPSGTPDNIIENWGLFSYELKLKEEAIAGGGVFDACWGEVLAVDLTPPQIDCPADVTGLIRTGDQYRPAFDPGQAGAGERFNYLTCNELDFVYRDSRSWEDETYEYYTGLPEAIDGCDEATLVEVDDWLEKPGCEDVSLAFGGQLSAKVIRTFTYEDARGNRGTCDQTIYFFRPWIQLPDCEVRLDYCTYGDDTVLDPMEVKQAPYYLNGLGDTVLLLTVDCGFSVRYDDQFFPGPENCGFKIRRTWTLLDDCRSVGLPVDLVRLPASAKGCAEAPEWEREALTFEQYLIVEDTQAPLVGCPAPPAESGAHVYSTGPFNCSAVVNPPAPVVSGECQDWTWSFELYGFVVNPVTLIPEYKLIGRSVNQLLSGVAPGAYDLIYQVEDACGNITFSEKCPVRVEDQINPIAVCDNELNISLGTGTSSGSGVAMILAKDIGEGSWDNCTAEVTLEVRRLIGADCLDTYVQSVYDPTITFSDLRRKVVAGIPTYYYNDEAVIVLESGSYYSAWGRSIFTTCCDAGLPNGVAVVLRVTDEAGNANTCDAIIVVDDQLAPRCTVQDQVISCTELDFDPRDAAQVAARFGTPEAVVTVFDNCEAGISEQLIWRPEQCGRGTLERVFTVTDAAGLRGACTQTISIEEVVDYEIRFPADASEVSCGEASGDDVFYETFGCDLLAVDRDTVPFDSPEGACHQIMIHYEVINWCEYGAVGITNPTRLPRDIDDDDQLDEPTWVKVAYDAAYDAVVAKVFGADESGNRMEIPSRIYKPGDTGYNPGYFRYTQFVNIIDNEAPEVEVLNEDLSFCSYGEVADGCSGDFSIQLRAVDNCPLSAVHLQEVKLLSEGVEIPSGAGAYSIQQMGSEFTVNGNLPIGQYRLSLQVSDGCGNPVGRNIDFEIVDCQAPVPICKGLISADLPPTDTDGDGRPDTGIAVIPAEAMIASEITDCSPFPDEPVHQVKYFVSRERPQRVEDLTDQSVTFNCDDNGVITIVYLSALDAAGNFGTCEVRVFIEAGTDPNPCDLFFGEGVIGGLINTEEGDPVEDVMVRLSGQRSDFVMTDYNGMYRFENLEEGYDYTVSPLKDEDYVNGVTTFDLLLISKHILAEDPLDSPYQLIAADANSDGRVTTFDLIQLRKLILTLTFDLENNRSWRFIDADYVFPDPTNPWLEYFPEILNMNDLDRIEEDGNFVAVKIGDVNGNAKTSRLLTAEVRSGRADFILRAEEKTLEAGREYIIPITGEGIRDIGGYQFTLELAASLAELVDIQYGLAGAENFGVFPGEGVVTTSWVKPARLDCLADSDDCPLFSVVLRPLRNVRLSEILSISSRYTPAEAYREEGTLLNVALRYEESGQAPKTPFRLYPNRPNPWRNTTTIGFNLPEAGRATLRILDVNGREVDRQDGSFAAGYNEFRLEKGQLPAGVLYYTVETAEQVETRKMIRMR